jgi:hypothetical protein
MIAISGFTIGHSIIAVGRKHEYGAYSALLRTPSHGRVRAKTPMRITVVGAITPANVNDQRHDMPRSMIYQLDIASPKICALKIIKCSLQLVIIRLRDTVKTAATMHYYRPQPVPLLPLPGWARITAGIPHCGGPRDAQLSQHWWLTPATTANTSRSQQIPCHNAQRNTGQRWG